VTQARPSSAQFGIDIEYDVGAIMMWLSGELDALSLPVFTAALGALADRARVVTIDLTHLRFCNIGGLRAMAELAARLNDVDGRVEIVAPAILTRMLELSDLRSLFVVHDLEPADTAGPTLDLRPVAPAPRTSRPRASSLHRLSSGT
jgi:anti-anti-sigma factor